MANAQKRGSSMRIKYNTWTGTYCVYRPGKPVQLRKNTTPKMREVMEKEPRIEGCFKIWEDDGNGKH